MTKAFPVPALQQQDAALRMHLSMCSGCNNFRRQMHTMRSSTQHDASGAAVSTSDASDGDR